MNNIDIANGMVFRQMGISNATFDERLVSQKKIYLLQSLGTDLGYVYNWYVRGPYSPSLTSYIYNNIDVLSVIDYSRYAFSHNAQNNIAIVNGFEALKHDKSLSTVSWYELLASLLYICNNSSSWHVDGQEEIVKKLIEYKPKYSECQCREALEVLRSYYPIIREVCKA